MTQIIIPFLIVSLLLAALGIIAILVRLVWQV